MLLFGDLISVDCSRSFLFFFSISLYFWLCSPTLLFSSSISFYFSPIYFLSFAIWFTISFSFFFTYSKSAPILPELIFESNSFWFFYSIYFTYFLFSICNWWKSINFNSSPISYFLLIWLFVFTIWVANVCFLFLYFYISAFFCLYFYKKNFYIRSASMLPVRLFSPPIRIYLWKSYASFLIYAIAISVSSKIAYITHKWYSESF